MTPIDRPFPTRRAFLAASAGTVAALAVGRPARAADPDSGLTVAVQSYTFRKFTLEQTLKRLQELGVRHGEFYSAHIGTNSSPEKLDSAKKLLAEYGVSPTAFGVVGFSKNADANRKLFEFAQKLGAKYLSCDPDPDSFDSLDKLVEEYKIPVAIHPHGPTGKGKQLHRWSSAEVILAAIKDHSPLIGTCLDTGHLIRTAQVAPALDPAQQIKVMGARNFGLHLKDHDNKLKEDVPFGDPAGVLKVAEVLDALKAVDFKGYVAIEYEAQADEPTESVRKCLVVLRKSAAALPPEGAKP